MNLLCTLSIGILVFLGVCKVSGEERGKDQYEHITQDSVRLDLDTGELQFNDRIVSAEELGDKVRKSYSISFGAGFYSEEPTDLFGAPSSDSAVGAETCSVSAESLLHVLEQMDSAGIDPKLVRLNFYMPSQLKRNKYHHIELGAEGKVILDGTEISVADLAARQLQGHPFVIDPKSKPMKVDYRHFLSVLRAMGSHAKLAGLVFADIEQVEVEAQIYQLEPDGTRDVLSAPKFTTKSGNTAMVGVVHNASGRNTYPPGTDEFHQEDLASLGIRFSATPQIIGDHLRVSGVAIMTKMKDRVGVFVQGNVPIASYSCTKTVVPFSVVFPPGTDTVDFPVAKVDGKETMCRLTVCVVDDKGMSQADREQARAMAIPPKGVH